MVLNNELKIKGNLILAPMQNFSELPFIKSYNKFFPYLKRAFTPYMATSSFKFKKPQNIKDYFIKDNEKLNITPQILSKSSQDFISLCNILQDNGCHTVNINFGCPYEKIVKKGRGAGMLRDLDFMKKFLDEIFSHCRVNLSLKIRSGVSNEEEIYSLINLINNYDFIEVIYHPRTAKQLYKGKANRELFFEAESLSKNKLIYNGDILNTGDYQELILSGYKLDKELMIGRGIFKDLFLTYKLKGVQHSQQEKKEIFNDFYMELKKEWRERLKKEKFFLSIMKSYFYYMSNNFINSSKLFSSLSVSNDMDSFDSLVWQAELK